MTAARDAGGALGRGARLVRHLLRNPEEALFAARMVAWWVALPVLKRAVPLARLAPLMWAGRGAAGRRRDLEITVARVDARLFPRSREGYCLERGLLLYRFLSLAGSNPTLVTGVTVAGSEVRGHAWVMVDGRPFNESALALEGFEPVLEFGDGGRIARRTSAT